MEVTSYPIGIGLICGCRWVHIDLQGCKNMCLYFYSYSVIILFFFLIIIIFNYMFHNLMEDVGDNNDWSNHINVA